MERVFRGFLVHLRTPIMELGVALQRSFSTFPDRQHGAALLLLRVTLSLSLFDWAIRDEAAAADLIALVVNWSVALLAVLVLAGLWTSVAGILISLDQASMAISHHFTLRGHLLLAALALCLAMLGPGAWSVDARRFGRKVFKAGDEGV